MRSIAVLLPLLAVVAPVAAGAATQEPNAPAPDGTSLSTAHFDGWRTWPLYRPGELAVDGARLQPLHLEFDAWFPGPDGFGRGPLDRMTMYMDVFEVNFHGRPAVWIQWTSTSPAHRTEAPALDMLVVDRATFRYLFRIGRSGPAERWGGRYEVVHVRPDGVTQVTVNDDGTTALKVLDGPANYFDFATYQFLFPLLHLETGLRIRLAGYEYLDKAEEILPARVVGRTEFTDAAGAGARGMAGRRDAAPWTHSDHLLRLPRSPVLLRLALSADRHREDGHQTHPAGLAVEVV